MKTTTFSAKKLAAWTTSVVALALSTAISCPKPTLAETSFSSENTPSTIIAESDSFAIAQLTQAHRPIYGNLTLRYSVDGILYESFLVMEGHSGMMRTRFFNPNIGETEMVDQTMQLRSSAQGLVLLGYDPVYAGTNTPNPTYSPDNFLFQIQPDGTFFAFTCDDAGRCSPVEIE